MKRLATWCRLERASAAAARASLAGQSSVEGKCFITSGSALRAANGSRSAGRQRRNTSRSVRNGPLIAGQSYG